MVVATEARVRRGGELAVGVERQWLTAMLFLAVSMLLTGWYLVAYSFQGGFIYLLLAGVGLVMYLVAAEAYPWRKIIGFNTKSVADDLAKGALVGVLFLGLGAASPAAAVGLPPFASSLPVDQRFIAIVFLAWLVEEPVFRGAAYSIFWNASGSRVAAAVLQAVIFSGYHILAYGALASASFIIAGVFGFSIALLNTQGGQSGEGSLWPGAMAHFVYNFGAYAIMVGLFAVGAR